MDLPGARHRTASAPDREGRAKEVTTSSPCPSRIGLECPTRPPRTMFKVNIYLFSSRARSRDEDVFAYNNG